VNLALLWNEYKLDKPDGCNARSTARDTAMVRKNSVTMHIQHKPGEKLFVDWAGDTWKSSTG